GVPMRAISSAVLGPGEVGLPAIAGSFQEPAWQRAFAERAGQDGAFRRDVEAAIAELPGTERAILGRGTQVGTGLGDPDLSGDAAQATLGLFREDRELRATRARLTEPGITHVVFNHTHVIVDGALEGHLYNPGTWLPRLDLSSPPVREKIK